MGSKIGYRKNIKHDIYVLQNLLDTMWQFGFIHEDRLNEIENAMIEEHIGLPTEEDEEDEDFEPPYLGDIEDNDVKRQNFRNAIQAGVFGEGFPDYDEIQETMQEWYDPDAEEKQSAENIYRELNAVVFECQSRIEEFIAGIDDNILKGVLEENNKNENGKITPYNVLEMLTKAAEKRGT